MVIAGKVSCQAVNCVIYSQHTQWKQFAHCLAAGRCARAEAGVALSARAGAEMSARRGCLRSVRQLKSLSQVNDLHSKCKAVVYGHVKIGELSRTLVYTSCSQ